MLAGACGPLLAAGKRAVVPVMVGELAAGALLGTAGLGVLHPSDPTFAFLANCGFLMLMFAAGMHVPVRSLAKSTLSGAGATLLCTGLGLGAGVAVHVLLGGPALVYALLMANSSAAVIVPLVQERRLDQRRLAAPLAQVTIADTLTIITLPMVLNPSRLAASVVGAVGVLAALGALTLTAFTLRRFDWVKTLRTRSRKRGWGLELRVSLIGVFILATVAQRAGISLMIAGFFAGLLLSWLGGRKRLNRQVEAVAQGFFVPIFFVALGAKLNVEQVFTHPSLLALTLTLTLGAAFVHFVTGTALGHGRVEGLLTTAQLGLPAAAAELGLKAHALSSGEAAAIMLSGLGAIGVSVIAARQLSVRREAAGTEALGDAGPKVADAAADRLKLRWLAMPELHDYEAAEAYLSLVLSAEQVADVMRQLRQAESASDWRAKDILKAAQLKPLPPTTTGVARKLTRVADGKPLSPVLLVRRQGAPLIVADGYRRASTSYLVGKNTAVPVLEASI